MALGDRVSVFSDLPAKTFHGLPGLLADSLPDRFGNAYDLLRVGTSAGGARAKAVIAWNRETHEDRSGRITAGQGFDYWLLKFDGVTGNKDQELEEPRVMARLNLRIT